MIVIWYSYIIIQCAARNPATVPFCCLHFWEFFDFLIVFAMEFSRFWEARVVIFGYFGSPGAGVFVDLWLAFILEDGASVRVGKCYWLGGVGGWGPYFISFLRKTPKCTYVLINTVRIIMLVSVFFFWKKPPEDPAYWSNAGVCLHGFLCMHKILVHAQHSCACTTLLCMHWRDQGPRPGPKTKTAAGRAVFCFGSRPWSLAPPVHAQECCAYTECCACTRILCMRKNLVYFSKCFNLFLVRLGTSFVHTILV